MKLRMAATIFAILVCAAMHTTSALAQGPQADGPLPKNGLMKMLLLNDSSQKDLIQLVTKRGVDFRPTPADEGEMHEAGASDDLIAAVRTNFKGNAAQSNPQTNQSTNPAAAANDAAIQSSSQTTSETAAPQKKKGFLQKLNSGMDKVNAKVNKANAEVNKQAQAVQATATQATQTAQSLKTQTTQTAQSLKTSGQATTSKGQSNTNAKDQTAMTGTTTQANTSSDVAASVASNNGNATQPVNASVPPTSNGNSPVSSSAAAPANLAGTSWDLLSMTKTGETEHVNQTTPNVQFCRDGSWAILHSGSSEGGKYQIQGSRIVMKTSDGALYGDYQIKRNGNEMVLDDGTWRLRLRYYSPVKC